jgi:Glycosyltransferase family 87
MRTSGMRRTLLTAGGIGLTAVLAAVQLPRLAESGALQPYDYLEYWSAGRAVLHGDNPYDGAVLYPLQAEAGTIYDVALMMWNPPWTLPLAMGLGAMPVRAGQFVWFIGNLLAVLGSAMLLWRAYDGPRRLTWMPIAVSLAFAPVAFLLLMGQISGFLLLGLAGFLTAVRSNRWALAGGLAALTAIKPHLLVLFALALALEAVRTRAPRKAVAAGGMVLLIAGLVPLAWNAHIWGQYRAATAASESVHPHLNDWEHPTLGYAIRHALPGQPFNAMFIPAGVAVAGFLVYWWVRRRDWSWSVELPRLTVVSLLAAPYGAWAFDLVLLLVPVVQATAWLAQAQLGRRTVAVLAAAYLVANALAIRTVFEPLSVANPWIAPITLAGYLFVGWLTRPTAVPRPAPGRAVCAAQF